MDKKYLIVEYNAENLSIKIIHKNLLFNEGIEMLKTSYGPLIIDIGEKEKFSYPKFNGMTIYSFYANKDDVLFLGGWFEYVTQQNEHIYMLVHESLINENIIPKYVEIDDDIKKIKY